MLEIRGLSWDRNAEAEKCMAFFSIDLLAEMLKFLGFRTRAKRVESPAWPGVSKVFMVLEPASRDLASLWVYLKVSTGHIMHFGSLEQIFCELCVSIDGFDLVDKSDPGDPVFVHTWPNPLKGARSLEELELKMAVFGGKMEEKEKEKSGE